MSNSLASIATVSYTHLDVYKRQDVTVTLNQEDGQWVVQEDQEFSNALTGGMIDFASDAMGSLS